MTNKNLLPFTQKEEEFIKKIVDKRVKAEARFPFITALFVTFGVVATLYGFEKMIDKVDLFSDHPWILLIIGLAVLGGTGAIYKKLN